MAELRGAFAEVDITPPGPIGLAGYFNERISTGVLDPLYAKVACFQTPGGPMALVICDLIGLPRSATDLLRGRVEKECGVPAANVLVACTHTHTGPATSSLFGLSYDASYIPDVLAPAVSAAVAKSLAGVARLTVDIGVAEEEGLAFNRRYWMKDGTVVTNPPKGDPNVVKPEGPADHTVRVYAFRRQGALVGILVDANNHSDTTGGNLISADWPGVLADQIKKRLDADVPVLLLNGLAGNINHFDRDNPGPQCSREEAVRIGTGYADAAMEALEGAEQITASPAAVASTVFDLPYRDVSQGEIGRAREVLENTAQDADRRLTSEELAKGDPQIERIFARGLLEFAELRERVPSEKVQIAGFRLGDAGFVGFPGEPFIEIGLAVQDKSPFPFTTVFELLGDVAGYIPMPDCFDRGGYEPRTHRYNRFTRDAAQIFIDQGTDVLTKLYG